MAKVIERGRGPNPWRIAGWGIAALLLLLPLVAMQFTHEVNWTAFDFMFAAVMIGAVGIAFELTVRATRNNAYRGALAIALAAAFLLIWINGAVGIIGDEDNPLNLLYIGVIAIAFGGMAIARFRAKGAARAMTMAAIANAAVGILAVVAGRNEPPGILGLIGLNGFFVLLFLGAARLFGIAADKQQRPE
jgi:CDP-diglyceride synthetase